MELNGPKKALMKLSAGEADIHRVMIDVGSDGRLYGGALPTYALAMCWYFAFATASAKASQEPHLSPLLCSCYLYPHIWTICKASNQE